MSTPPARPRVTISEMMAVVLIAAITFAAVSGAPGGLGAAAIVLGIISLMGLLLVAIIGVIYRRGRSRAFWIGFALFGWPSFLWTLYFLNHGPFDGPFILFFLGVPPYAWLGGSIARKFAS